jgi:hypothetical protein
MVLEPFTKSAEVVASVNVALVAKSSVAVKPVEDAYGNCEARRVDDEKKTPWVQMLVVVAAVVVPNVSVPIVNGNAEPPPVASVPQ